MKTCYRCKEIYPLNIFYLNKANKDKLGSYCKKCSHEIYKNRKHKYVQKNKHTRKNNQSYWKEYRKTEKGLAYLKKYQQTRVKERMLTDVQFRLSRTLRRRLWCAIRGKQKTGSFVSDLGCSITELKIYLEKQFQDGMTWENNTVNGWHIDHIKPLASFDLNDREQFLKACHYTNLQPMWAKDNWHKSNR